MSVKYSVVVLTYNQLKDATIPCIESLLKYCPPEETEIIVVDNASQDSTRSYLKSIHSPAVSVIFNDSNLGFSGGNNVGIRKARGAYVVILNNDTLVTPNWLERLTSPFEKDSRIGLVGPVTNYAGTEQRITLAGLSQENYLKVSEAYTDSQRGVYFPTKRLSFFCVAIKRELISRIGLLDEVFARGMFEDDDYCTRATEKGYTIAVAEDCFVYHKGSAAFSALKRKQYDELFERNKLLYERKHAAPYLYSSEAHAYFNKIARDLAKHRQVVGTDPILERLHVRMDAVQGYLAFLTEKERQLHRTAAGTAPADFVFKASRPVETVLEENDKLQRRVARTADDVEAFDRELNAFLENPVFIAWQRFNRMKFHLANFLRGKRFIRRFNPYNAITHLKPIHIDVVSRHYPEHTSGNFSLVVTVMNEEKTIDVLLGSIADQTLIPNEVIVVDGGSTDSTVKVIRRSSLGKKTKLIIISGKKHNIPQGRNVGIKRASNEIIVSTDAGCILEHRFLQNITGPLFANRSLDLVGGIYRSWHRDDNQYFIPNWKKNDWNVFLPSARAVAFRKSKALRIGLFPEHLDMGEDTLFDLRYRSISKRWMYNTAAVVFWKNPKSYTEYIKLAHRYGYGDGLSGVGDVLFYFRTYHQEIDDTKILYDRGAFYRGYLQGRGKRSFVEKNRLGLRKLALLFIHDLESLRGQNVRAVLGKLREEGCKTIVVFNTCRRRGEKAYRPPTDIGPVEFFHIRDFNVLELVDRYDAVFSNVVVVLATSKNNRIISDKCSRMEAFFSVRYKNMRKTAENMERP